MRLLVSIISQLWSSLGDEASGISKEIWRKQKPPWVWKTTNCTSLCLYFYENAFGCDWPYRHLVVINAYNLQYTSGFSSIKKRHRLLHNLKAQKNLKTGEFKVMGSSLYLQSLLSFLSFLTFSLLILLLIFFPFNVCFLEVLITAV